MRCLSCGKASGLEVIRSRGYLWHVPCAKVLSYADGTLYVDFPSDGKIAPSTICSADGHSWDRDANAAHNLFSQIPADLMAEIDLRENGANIPPIPKELAGVAVFVHSIE